MSCGVVSKHGDISVAVGPAPDLDGTLIQLVKGAGIGPAIPLIWVIFYNLIWFNIVDSKCQKGISSHERIGLRKL